VGLKRYAKAAAEFRESIRLDPKDPTGHLFLGKTYLAMGDKLHAQQTYRILLSLDKEKARELYAEINK
jgi:Tfp pilus assembly protein PilF